ncbi:enolase 4 [Pseudophryne corroboree]|uniref:enolase 4 n=1 Tax=Pseudophryne corroboree TaxID=495146 RepID=UPI0030820C8E
MATVEHHAALPSNRITAWITGTDMSREAAAAAEYYRSKHVPERLEQALTSAFYRGPEDVYGHLANYFAEISMPPVISTIRGRKVLDGIGQTTLEAEVSCTVRNTNKSICSVIISADYLTCDTVEANEVERKQSVETAIDWIQDYISPSLKGIQPNEQGKIDQLLSNYYKMKKAEERAAAEEVTPSPTLPVPAPAASPVSGKKKGSGKGKPTAALEKPIPPMEPPEPATRGSIAIGAVSLGVAKCSALLSNIPLYSYISALKHEQLPSELVLPTPLITLLSYGKSSPGKLNLMEEVMLVPKPGLTAREVCLLHVCPPACLSHGCLPACLSNACLPVYRMAGCLPDQPSFYWIKEDKGPPRTAETSVAYSSQLSASPQRLDRTLDVLKACLEALGDGATPDNRMRVIKEVLGLPDNSPTVQTLAPAATILQTALFYQDVPQGRFQRRNLTSEVS